VTKYHGAVGRHSATEPVIHGAMLFLVYASALALPDPPRAGAHARDGSLRGSCKQAALGVAQRENCHVPVATMCLKSPSQATSFDSAHHKFRPAILTSLRVRRCRRQSRLRVPASTAEPPRSAAVPPPRNAARLQELGQGPPGARPCHSPLACRNLAGTRREPGRQCRVLSW